MEHRGRTFRFGDVEVREGEFSVRKDGQVLPVEPKAYKVLEFLLSNPGRVVSKNELLDAVWSDVEVSESSLTRAIAILRRLLGDDVHEQRFIATVATVGYRFVAPVEVVEEGAAEIAEAPPAQTEPEAPAPVPVPAAAGQQGPRWLWWAGAGAVMLLVLVAVALWRRSPGQPVVEGVTQLTDDGNPKLLFWPVLSDGLRIYFGEVQGSSEVVAQVAATGGRTGVIATGIEILHDLAPDASSLLVWSHQLKWSLLPLPSGEPQRLSGLAQVITQPFLGSASFAPVRANFTNDAQLYWSVGRSFYRGEQDGTNAVKITELPNLIYGWVFSPDGKRIRLWIRRNAFRRSLWEMNVDGSSAHPLLPGWQSDADTCCGRWTADGRFFVFQSRVQGRTDLWALPEQRWFGRASSPLRLTNGPLSYVNPFPSADGKHLYAVGIKNRGELVRYDRKSAEFVPYLSGISATDATASTDGKWIAYMSYPDHSLWRVRADGTDRLQLTYPPVLVEYPRISPDGTKVAYGERASGAVYVISMEGGLPRKIESNAMTASWSPDGNSLVLYVPDATSSASVLETADLRTGKVTPVPEAAGKGGTFWPAADLLVAQAWWNGTSSLDTFDFKTNKWSHLVSVPNLLHWMQSVDGKYTYYMTGGDDPEVLRVRFSDGAVEKIVSLKGFRSAEDEELRSWLGVTADGDPLLTRDIGTQEIYDLTVRWP